MYVIRAGRRLLNLDYMIMAEEGEPGSPVPPGSVRVTMESGKEFDLVGPDADEFRRGASLAIQPGEPSGSGEASMAVRVVPDPSGDLPSSVGQRKHQG
jgi:hypothetical protein